MRDRALAKTTKRLNGARRVTASLKSVPKILKIEEDD